MAALFGAKKRGSIFSPGMEKAAMPPMAPTQQDSMGGGGLLGANAPAKKPGFFQSGGAGQYVLAGISDFLDRQAGRQPTAGANLMAMIQQRQQAAADQAAEQRKRSLDMADWTAKEQWKLDHPAPVQNDTVNDYEFIKQTMGEEAAKTFLQNKADPPQYRQGPDGQFYRVSPPVTAPVGKLTPITGGPVSNGGGGFR